LFVRTHEKLRVRLTVRQIKRRDKTLIVGERYYNLFVLLISALSTLGWIKISHENVIRNTKRSATNLIDKLCFFGKV